MDATVDGRMAAGGLFRARCFAPELQGGAGVRDTVVQARGDGNMVDNM
jgi:hypothetical protein